MNVNEDIWGRPGQYLWCNLPVKPVVDAVARRAEETGEDPSYLWPLLNTSGIRNALLKAAVDADPEGAPMRWEEHAGYGAWFAIDSDWWSSET